MAELTITEHDFLHHLAYPRMNFSTGSKELRRLFAAGRSDRDLLPVVIDGHNLPAVPTEKGVIVDLWQEQRW